MVFIVCAMIHTLCANLWKSEIKNKKRAKKRQNKMQKGAKLDDLQVDHTWWAFGIDECARIGEKHRELTFCLSLQMSLSPRSTSTNDANKTTFHLFIGWKKSRVSRWGMYFARGLASNPSTHHYQEMNQLAHIQHKQKIKMRSNLQQLSNQPNFQFFDSSAEGALLTSFIKV